MRPTARYFSRQKKKIQTIINDTDDDSKLKWDLKHNTTNKTNKQTLTFQKWAMIFLA